MKLDLGDCLQIRREMTHSSAQNKYFYMKFLSMVFFMVLPIISKITR